jgi:hypothetical protein
MKTLRAQRFSRLSGSLLFGLLLITGTVLALAGGVPAALAATCSVPSGSYATITAAVNDVTCDLLPDAKFNLG